jgi:MOSC domain-containing protein YiiM
MSGRLESIHIARSAAGEMETLATAELLAGQGIVGDRYLEGAGTFSKAVPGPDHEITLVEVEELAAFNAAHSLSLPPAAFRRNLATSGIRLNDLVGQEFAVGDAIIRGIRLCEPCRHLIQFTHSAVLMELRGRCGLRAEIVQGGVIRPGDVIAPRPA